MEKLSRLPFINGPITIAPKGKKERPESGTVPYRLIFGYSGLLLFVGLILSPIQKIIPEMITILTSPSQLITDYIELASLGGAFINTGLLTLLMTIIVYWQRVPISGPMIAAIFMVSGFGLFGKDILNSLPMLIGVYLYSKVQRKPFSQHAIIALFGSALSPVVSMFAFDGHLPVYLGLPAGYVLGILIGFVLVPLAAHVQSFTHGFNLYNVGFTSGILGMLLIGLFGMFGWEVQSQHIIFSGADTILVGLLLGFAVLLIALGIFYCVKEKSSWLKFLFKASRKADSDFIVIAGLGTTLINMGLMAIVLLAAVKLMGGSLNGPVLGAIITAIGFSAYGCHPVNSIPLLFGVYLACAMSIYDITTTQMLLVAVFSTTLAPISGYYGVGFGILAGIFHMALATKISALHGGLNLYHNGFSGGFVAALMVPLLDSLGVGKDKNSFGRKFKSKQNR